MSRRQQDRFHYGAEAEHYRNADNDRRYGRYIEGPRYLARQGALERRQSQHEYPPPSGPYFDRTRSRWDQAADNYGRSHRFVPDRELGGYNPGAGLADDRDAEDYGWSDRSRDYRVGEHQDPYSGGMWENAGNGTAEWRRPGQSFRGFGPKGYERSDERLKEMICDRLCDDDQLDASEISIQVSKGDVTLTGEVPDRTSKFRAEQLVDSCGSVKEIHNQLRVSAKQAFSGSASAKRLIAE